MSSTESTPLAKQKLSDDQNTSETGEPSAQPIEAEPATDPARPGPLSILQSVMAAAIGVQSEQKRHQDFEHGKPADYILYGVIFTIVFIFSIILVVNIVLS